MPTTKELKRNETIQTFRSNLAHAVWNKEDVQLGGGIFDHKELKVVLEFLETAMTIQHI